MIYKTGQKVLVRLIRDNHLHERQDKALLACGVIVEAHAAHGWYIVEFYHKKAVLREAFKADDIRPL